MARTRDDDDDRIRQRPDDEDRPRRRRRDDDDDDRIRQRPDDRPRSRQRDDDDDDDDDRPRRRRRDDDDDDYDDRPRRRPRRDSDLPRLRRDDLRTVAWAQKIIIFCILGNLATIPLRFALEAMPAMAGLASLLLLIVFYLAIAITATVCVFMMAVKVYSTGTGVLFGFLTLIPCVGLIMLLIINAKATAVMKEHKIRVGLLGARMSDLP
jgi:hypothetical protein